MTCDLRTVHRRHGVNAITASLALAVIVSASSAGQAQTSGPADPAEALARPISPGSVALLLPHASQPAVVERLTQALADPRPEVRAVAARVVFTTRHQALASALTAALEKEQSPVAGAEIVRALTLLRGPAVDAAIRAALPRLDSRATEAWTDTLVRTRPADLWRQIGAMTDAAPLAGLLFDAAVAQPDAASEAFANLKSTPALRPACEAILSYAGRVAKLPPWPIVAAALDTPGPPRQGAAFLLLGLQANEVALPPEAVAAVRELPAATDLAWMPLYSELQRRRAEPTTPPRPLVPLIEKLDATTVPEGLRYSFIMASFDQAEVEAFRRIAGAEWNPTEPPKGVEFRPMTPLEATRSVSASAPPTSVTRLARPLSVALMRDLVSLLKCSPVSGRVGLLDVQYRPTGQVRGVSRTTGGPAGCQQLASIVASLEVAPGHQRADERVDHLVIGLRPSDLSCERYTPVLEAQPVRPGGRITPPKKTRNVQPVYPDAAQKQGIQGVVVIEASIPTSGCVAEARVLRSVPGLDDAAVAAVSEWQYEPLHIDGKPAPVIMTVTVNFTLTR